MEYAIAIVAGVAAVAVLVVCIIAKKAINTTATYMDDSFRWGGGTK